MREEQVLPESLDARVPTWQLRFGFPIPNVAKRKERRAWGVFESKEREVEREREGKSESFQEHALTYSRVPMSTNEQLGRQDQSYWSGFGALFPRLTKLSMCDGCRSSGEREKEGESLEERLPLALAGPVVPKRGRSFNLLLIFLLNNPPPLTDMCVQCMHLM